MGTAVKRTLLGAVVVTVVGVGLVLVAILSTSISLGAGYIFSLVLPLGLFQASLLSLGSIFVVAFTLAAVRLCVVLGRYVNSRLDEEDDEDDEDDEDKEDPVGLRTV